MQKRYLNPKNVMEFMQKQMLYSELAKYYDLIYSWKNYKKEAKKIKEIVSKYKKSKGRNLLDVACGTGMHLLYLKKNFSCTGVDLNDGVLRVAKKKVKGVFFKKADMKNLKLGRKFDVITCLFSSIGYAENYSNLGKIIRNFSTHLEKGGVLIIEPWLSRSTFKIGMPFMSTYDGKEIKIARLNASKRKGNVSIIEFHYLVAEKGKDVKYFVDKHELTLFDVHKMLHIMRKNGIDVKFFKKGFMKGRGLFVGVKK